ncbi:hypothetical protein B0H63DRAFT_454792 [Podospora didyma]|uniref:Uncharacterized protein n=1 Tax=Podospora didyma TaxID=330526 RepID=A0AAE0K5Q2_9PEZI|nr:hypothetical protein B0H63DRAFT_454792 [Podospora didyma]
MFEITGTHNTNQPKENGKKAKEVGLWSHRAGEEIPLAPHNAKDEISRHGFNCFAERRILLFIIKTTNHKLNGSYTSVVLSSDKEGIKKLTTSYINRERNVVSKTGYWCSLSYAALVIKAVLQVWIDEWTAVLSEIDDCVRLEAHDIFQPSTRNRLMFDDCFKLSETYFMIIQLLRVFTGTIRQAGPLFDEVIERLAKDGFSEPDTQLASRLRKDIKTLYTEGKERLLGRIDEKMKEIESLRSGRFNATPLREASNSTKISRFVMALTIDTVMYSPPALPRFAAGKAWSTFYKIASTTVLGFGLYFNGACSALVQWNKRDRIE